MKSILKEAEMLSLKDFRDVDPEQTINFFSFKKIITAQNCLLYECYNLLHSIGEKFSFYLYPYGKSFEEIIHEIDNELIKADWKVAIVEKNPDSITVEVQNCIFCSEIGVPCDLFEGFLVHSLKKSLPDNRQVTYSETKKSVKDPTHNTYQLKLKCEKNK